MNSTNCFTSATPLLNGISLGGYHFAEVNFKLARETTGLYSAVQWGLGTAKTFPVIGILIALVSMAVERIFSSLGHGNIETLEGRVSTYVLNNPDHLQSATARPSSLDFNEITSVQFFQPDSLSRGSLPALPPPATPSLASLLERAKAVAAKSVPSSFIAALDSAKKAKPAEPPTFLSPPEEDPIGRLLRAEKAALDAQSRELTMKFVFSSAAGSLSENLSRMRTTQSDAERFRDHLDSSR